MKNYFKIFILFFFTFLTSCKVENNIIGNWFCVSGDYYKNGRFDFLHNGDLIIDFVSRENRSQIGYKGTQTQSLKGIRETPLVGNINYTISVPKVSISKFRIEGNFIYIDFGKKGSETQFQIERSNEHEIILINNNSGDFIKLIK